MLPNEVFALKCRERYAEDGLIVDQSNGEFAHCPLPRSMGDSGYYLLHEDHQWQGLLQSKDLGRRCYYVGHAKRWLMKANFVEGYFELWDIYDEFNGGVHHSHKGKQFSEESRRRMSKARKGVPLSEETRRRMSKARKGERNTNFGKRGVDNHLSKPLIVTTPCGSEIRYESVREAQRELGANKHIFRFLKTSKMVTRGKFKGWKFRYA